VSKESFALLASLFIAFCSAPVPVSADALTTSVKGRNIQDISRDVQQWHDAQHADCKFSAVTQATVVEKNGDSTTEHWTIKACNDQEFTYKVFIMSRQGGITDMVSNVDGSAAK